MSAKRETAPPRFVLLSVGQVSLERRQADSRQSLVSYT
jgi:hypothetical protein